MTCEISRASAPAGGGRFSGPRGLLTRRVEEFASVLLKRSAEIDAGGISVKVQDDRVVLEGGVRAWNERGVAERTAWSVPGVATVENHIRIN